MAVKLTEEAQALLASKEPCGCPSSPHMGPCKDRFTDVTFDFKPGGTYPDEKGRASRRQGIGARKRWERRLDRYAAARAQGMRPSSTKTRDIEQAERVSDNLGRAFDGRTDGGYATADKLGVKLS